jgi:type VI secretion system protein ImpK
MWLIASVLLVLLALVYGGFRWSLGNKADPVFSALASLDAKKTQVAAPPPPPAAAPIQRLSGLLAPEIKAGLVDVQDLADRSTVVIRGDGFFESGSTTIAPGVRACFRASAGPGHLKEDPHHRPHRQPTDPLAALPVNWHLSQACRPGTRRTRAGRPGACVARVRRKRAVGR